MGQIVAKGLTKTFRKNHKKWECAALKEIDFTIEAGESVGIIGRNGSGKSTLLKLICAVTAPTRGVVSVQGRVGALLELGAGFHPEYTGIENLYLSGAVHGIQRNEVEKKIPEILEFSEIGEMAHRPVKTYSDGMFVRLAFAAAICTGPDILVIDEALAVGDILFQAKCFQKLEELKKKGVTLLYVSHDVDSVRRVCDRVLWLEDGRLQMDGSVAEVTAAYIAYAKSQGEEMGVASLNAIRRFGSAVGAITKVDCPLVWEWNESVSVSVQFKTEPPVEEDGLTISLSVKNLQGLDLLVLSQAVDEKKRSGTVVFRFPSPFCSGRYLLAVGLERRKDTDITYYDYWEGVKIVRGESEHFGVFHIPAEVEVYETEREYLADQQ